MPQRRLLASTLAGLLAMVGFPGLGPSTAVQAQSEQDCQEADCATEDQTAVDDSASQEWDTDADAQPGDEFADSSESEDQSLAAEPEPESEDADFSQANEEEESAEFAEAEDTQADGPPATESPAEEVAAEPKPATTPDPPAPALAPTQPAQQSPAPPAPAPASAVRTQIRTFVERGLNGATFADSDDIFALGYVNSMFALQLVHFCESTLGVQVDSEDLDVGNFRSVDNMVAFVERKQGR